MEVESKERREREGEGETQSIESRLLSTVKME